MKLYLTLCLYFSHKSIKVYGKENVPEKGALLFIANHQNAFIDAILIPTTTNREVHFLTRASAFKIKIIAKLLDTLNMIPIFRVRDGFSTISKNKEIFSKCYDILKRGGAIQIFAEGEHHLERKILPLKKGFARIILGTLKKYKNTEIKIIPVGLNYDSHTEHPASVGIYYGEPILANKYIDVDEENPTFSRLTSKVTEGLKKVTVHIEENYEEKISLLKEQYADFTNPTNVYEILQNRNSNKQKSKENLWWKPFHLIAILNAIFPILVWKSIKSIIKEKIFTSTFRLAVIGTLFPIFFLIQTVIVANSFSIELGIVYFVLSIILGIIYIKTSQVSIQ